MFFICVISLLRKIIKKLFCYLGGLIGVFDLVLHGAFHEFSFSFAIVFVAAVVNNIGTDAEKHQLFLHQPDALSSGVVQLS